MTKDDVLAQIGKELATGKWAVDEGNKGMARVCARRAAGIAVSFWLQTHPQVGWGVDAMSQLRSLQREHSIPQSVRDAALRLTTKITEQFTAPFTTDPLDDSNLIIHYLMDLT